MTNSEPNYQDLFGDLAKVDTNEQPSTETNPENSQEPQGETAPERLFDYDDNTQEALDQLDLGSFVTNEEEEDDAPEENPWLIKVSTSETESDSYDLSKKEDKEKVAKYLAEYKKVAPQMQAFESEKASLEHAKSVAQDAIKLMYSKTLYQGAANEDNLIEKPFELYVEMAGGDREKAVKLAMQDKKNIQRISEFSANYMDTAKKFVSMKEDFVKKYPDVGNVDEWIAKNVNPVVEPILSYGEKPLNPELFDAIYFWKNKDKILSQFKAAVIKEFAKKPTNKLQTKGVAKLPNNATPTSGRSLDAAINTLRARHKGEKILIKGF